MSSFSNIACVRPPPPASSSRIGLGNMGAPMAANLAKHLNSSGEGPLLTFNRTLAKVDDLAASLPSNAIKRAESLEQIGQESDLIISSLANDSAARSVIEGVLAGIKKNAGSGKKVVIVATSTVSAETARELSKLATAVDGVSYVQAPAFGPPPMAAEAKLVFVLAGPPETKSAIEPYLVPAVGRKTLDLGDDPGKSSIFKLVGNGFIAGLIELLAESMTLANASGVGDDAFLGFIKEFVPAPSAIGYGTKMVKSAFDAQPNGFAIDGGLKDINHILNLGAATGAKLPILDIAKAHLEHVKELQGDAGSKLDWSAMVAAQRADSGMSAFKEGKAAL